VDHLLHGLPRHVRAHAVVDAPAREDHLGVVARELGLVREVVRDRRRCNARRPGPGGS
jgi:hypothetical protein